MNTFPAPEVDKTKRRMDASQAKAFQEMLKLRLHMEELAKTFDESLKRKAELADAIRRI